MSLKITEKVIQTVLIRRAIYYWKHDYVVPNSTVIINYSNESDLISVTKAGLIHEYEIKLNLADYHRDFEKRRKHEAMQNGLDRRTPSYFWFVTHGFHIEPPEYAGWILIEKGSKHLDWIDKIKAPRLHTNKLTGKQLKTIGRILSHRLSDAYDYQYPDTYESPVEVFV